MNKLPASPTITAPGRGIFIRVLLVVLASCSWLLAPSTTAQAHASLVRSVPRDGASLTESPADLRLWFSDPIVLSVSSFQLSNSRGEAADVQAQSDPVFEGMVILNVPALAPGAYALVWHVLSDDGHVTGGHLVFGIGASAATASSAAPGETLASRLDAVPNVLDLITIVGFIGAVICLVLVLEPVARRIALPEAAQGLARARRRALGWIAFWAIASVVVGLLVAAWRVEDLRSGSSLSESALTTAAHLLISTRWGGLWLARQAVFAFAGLVIVLELRPPVRGGGGVPGDPGGVSVPGSRLNGLLLGACGLSALLQAAGGHAATAPAPGWAVSAIAVHIIAAGAWVGGIFALISCMHPARSAFPGMARVCWAQFSPVAAVSVCLLFATGLYSAGIEVASLSALFDSRYGLTLAAKVGLVVAAGCTGLLSSAMLHRFRLPFAARVLRRQGSDSRLSRTVALEAAIGLGVLVVTGLLVAAPPARGRASVSAPPSVATGAAADLVVSVELRPNQPGAKVMLVRISDTRRPSPAAITSVSVRIAGPGQGSVTAEIPAALSEAGLYQADGSNIDRAGDWVFTVIVERAGLIQAEARFDWQVGPALSGEESSGFARSAALGLSLNATAILISAGLLFATLARLGPRAWPTRAGARRSGINS